MQTFDQSLMVLYREKLITFEEALRQSTNPDDFTLKVSGISGSRDDAIWGDFEGGGGGEGGEEKGKGGGKGGKGGGSAPPSPDDLLIERF